MTLTLVGTSTGATPAGQSWLERLRPDAALPIPESVAEPELVDAVLRRLGPDAVAWAAQVGAEAAARICDRFPSFKNDTHLRPGTESTTLSALLSMLDQTAAVPPITHDATINIRRCVTRGVTFDEVLNGIRQAHATMSEAFLAACDRLAPAEQRAAVLRRASAQLFDHIDRFARMASEIYEFEQSCSAATPAVARATVVRKLVGKGADEARQTHSIDEMESILQYSLRQRQQAFAVSQVAPSTSPPSIEDLRRLGYQLARASGARHHLVHAEDGEIWVWLGGAADGVDLVTEMIIPPEGFVISAGASHSGELGFRKTIEEAWAVRELRATVSQSPAVWHYRDVELVLLMLADFSRAQSFVTTRLDGLLTRDRQTAELRNTLRTYFDAHSSPNEAARRLHVARNTVSARVQKASECLKRDFNDDTLDLHAALFLVDLFGDAILPRE